MFRETNTSFSPGVELTGEGSAVLCLTKLGSATFTHDNVFLSKCVLFIMGILCTINVSISYNCFFESAKIIYKSNGELAVIHSQYVYTEKKMNKL